MKQKNKPCYDEKLEVLPHQREELGIYYDVLVL